MNEPHNEMIIEFSTYNNCDGTRTFIRLPEMILLGPLVPGTSIIYVPIAGYLDLCFGIIIAVCDGQVDVAWSEWKSGPYRPSGELRRLLVLGLLGHQEP